MSQASGAAEKRLNVEYFEGVNSLVGFHVAKKTELAASENARSVVIGTIEKRAGQTVLGKAVGGAAFTTNNNYGIFYFNTDIATNQGLYRLSQASTAGKATLFYLSELGVVTAITLMYGGTGYTTASGVATTGGSGTGCTVSYTASGGIITAITAVSAGGANYINGETLTVSGGGANATFTITTVNAWTPLTGKGADILAGLSTTIQAEENLFISNYYDYNRYVSGADGTTVYDSQDAAGHLFNSPKAKFVNYYKNRLYLANFKQEVGTVTGATIVSGGTGYSNSTNVATTGGSGTGCAVDITVSAGIITAIVIHTAGTGYKENETLTVTTGGGNATFLISTTQTLYKTTILRSSYPLGIISLVGADVTPSGATSIQITDSKYFYTTTGAKEYEIYRGPTKIADISVSAIQDATITATVTFQGAYTTLLASDEIWVSGTYTGAKKFRWVNNGSITGRDVKQYDTFKLSGGSNDEITMLTNIGNIMMVANKNSLSSWNDYTLENFDLGIGCVSPKGQVKLLGSLFFLHYSGVYSTQGGIPKLISNKIERYINGATTAGKEASAAGKKGRSIFFTLGDVTLYYPDGSVEKTLSNVCVEYNLTQENWFIHTNVKATEFATFIDSTNSDRCILLDTTGNKAAKAFLEGTTDDGDEIFMRVDLNKFTLQPMYENTNNVNSIIVETERGNSLKIYVATNEGNPEWYEVPGTAVKGISLVKVMSKDGDHGQPVPIRLVSVSLRDSSKQTPKILRMSVIYLPGTVNATDVEK